MVSSRPSSVAGDGRSWPMGAASSTGRGLGGAFIRAAFPSGSSVHCLDGAWIEARLPVPALSPGTAEGRTEPAPSR